MARLFRNTRQTIDSSVGRKRYAPGISSWVMKALLTQEGLVRFFPRAKVFRELVTKAAPGLVDQSALRDLMFR